MRNVRVQLASAIAFALSAALLQLPATALEGGTLARAADPLARAVVSIQAIGPARNGRVRVRECTGVLIARDLVLTAGHCLEEVSGPERIGVFFFKGSSPIPTVVTVRALTRHPAYRRGWENQPGEAETRQHEIAADLALLRLSKPAPADRIPVGLSLNPATAEGGRSKFVAAGLSGAGPKARSGTLKVAALDTVRFTAGTPKIAFGSASPARACVGDSGGPVASADGRIWGVVSAVLRPSGGCGGRIVVAPVNPEAMATMIARVGSSK
jgi:S1-C subfamily serine protease